MRMKRITWKVSFAGLGCLVSGIQKVKILEYKGIYYPNENQNVLYDGEFSIGKTSYFDDCQVHYIAAENDTLIVAIEL